MDRLHAIPLKHFPYSESSVIVKCYTQEMGLISVLCRGVKKRSGRKSGQLPLLQPKLLEAKKSPKSDLFVLTDSSSLGVFDSCSENPRKIALTFFVSNVAYNLLQPEMSVPGLFDFFGKFMSRLETQSVISNIHFTFLNQVALLLGIAPANNYAENRAFFDIPSAAFVDGNENHICFSKCLGVDLDDFSSIQLSSKEKSTAIEIWEKYFSYHLGYYRPSQSLPVLVQLFSD